MVGSAHPRGWTWSGPILLRGLGLPMWRTVRLPAPTRWQQTKPRVLLLCPGLGWGQAVSLHPLFPLSLLSPSLVICAGSRLASRRLTGGSPTRVLGAVWGCSEGKGHHGKACHVRDPQSSFCWRTVCLMSSVWLLELRRLCSRGCARIRMRRAWEWPARSSGSSTCGDVRHPRREPASLMLSHAVWASLASSPAARAGAAPLDDVTEVLQVARTQTAPLCGHWRTRAW